MKLRIILTTAAIAVIATSGSHAATFDAESAIESSKSNKPKKIKDRTHPDYVRCRSEPVIGSLARKKRICMTNKEWAAHNLEGSKRSKEFVDDMQTGLNNSGQ